MVIIKLIISLILLPVLANAKPLFLEVSKGKYTKVPIAIVPFDVAAAKNGDDEVKQISNIIAKDLFNSGQFEILENEKVKQFPRQLQEVNFIHWRSMEVEYLLIGQIITQKNGLLKVSFQLLDIVKQQQTPLINMDFNDKTSMHIRSLAHYISDMVFYKITGVKGVSSTKLAYITTNKNEGKIYHKLTIADADGYNVKDLVKSGAPLMSPVWAPDGRKIAFVSFQHQHSSIKTVELVSGKIDTISSYPGINGAPAWSRDGNHMALVLSKDGAPKIYTLNLQNKKLKQITRGSYIDTEPCWSPQGDSLYFTSNREGKPQIYQVSLRSGSINRVTSYGDYNASPCLTPSGQSLLILHKHTQGFFAIAVKNLKTDRLKLLTDFGIMAESPSISPNGLMALYSIQENNNTYLGMSTLDGRFKIRVPADTMIKEPVWSPFLINLI